MDIAFAAERWASFLARSIPDALVLAILLVAALALALVAYGRHKRRRKLGAAPEGAEGAE